MLTTLILATATMAAPATIAPVNFVHGYRQGCKLTYEMAFGFVTGLELTMTFDLAVGATNNGKTDVLLEVTDRGAFSISEEEGAIHLVLDANGVPVMDDIEGMKMTFYFALLTTYLPDKPLDEGDTFEFRRETDAFETSSKGRFSGMEAVDGTTYAVLESEATVIELEGDEDKVTLKIKTYYNPANKRVERTYAEVSTSDGDFSLSLKMK